MIKEARVRTTRPDSAYSPSPKMRHSPPPVKFMECIAFHTQTVTTTPFPTFNILQPSITESMLPQIPTFNTKIKYVGCLVDHYPLSHVICDPTSVRSGSTKRMILARSSGTDALAF